MSYFIISNSDGDTTVQQVSKDELLKRIQPDDGEDCCYYGCVGFLEAIKEADTNYWGENILIIKGEIVTPKPKRVIETFEID